MSVFWSASGLHIITAAVCVCVCVCVLACVWICLRACDCGPVPLPATVPQLILHRSSAGCLGSALHVGNAYTPPAFWARRRQSGEFSPENPIRHLQYYKSYVCTKRVNRFRHKALKSVIVTAIECLTFSW